MKRLFALVGLIIFIAIVWFIVGLYNSFNSDLTLQESISFEIPSGATFSQIADKLKEQGVIASEDAFLWLARLEDAKLVAGEYTLEPGTTLKELLQRFNIGDANTNEVTVKFIEGDTILEMADRLVQSGLISEPEEFLTAASQNVSRFQYEFLASKPSSVDLEGYLFPDTYRFFNEASVDDVINKLLETFDQKLTDQMRQDIADSGRSIHEVITLASIIEKEVQHPEDMKTVSGLFMNRLDIGMALQADSTVNYITLSGRDRSTLQDLQIDSPYNTYKYAGLPPGPISNPGLNAINAAIYPNQTDYLFFVTDSTGKVYYATDFAGHNRNIELYLD